MRPLLRYAALYAAVELAAVILLCWAIGLGWTLVVIAATFMLGVVLAASQLKGQVGSIRRARTNPQAAAADGVLVGLGSFLVFLPGVVSTVAGALMLAPPTRAAMRPLAATLLTRGAMRGLGALNFEQVVNRPGRSDYIDGEVIGDPVHRPAAARAAIVRRAGG
ncbi:MAG: FxsA family protein [Mycobacteriaceae bacterium]